MKKCDLDDLNLSDNRIVDISPLGLDPQTKQLTLKLSYLNLMGNRIVNIDALEDQTSLRELYFSDNYIYISHSLNFRLYQFGLLYL
ncbi:Leucine-rich_repeat domain superfamily [Hexamita inflata]|uniref:Leucine-rich repeat domain superfamily n=1 Tax=Hexamita inflata TaxID=28002 RepID=A0AA86N5G1_9EUKA|nr:Leucine-rich repeat domain superfamily [Hexamita inflata]